MRVLDILKIFSEPNKIMKVAVESKFKIGDRFIPLINRFDGYECEVVAIRFDGMYSGFKYLLQTDDYERVWYSESDLLDRQVNKE